MIHLTYSHEQRFRYRHRDVNILGRTDARLPLRSSTYSLNGGPAEPFYVEHVPHEGTDWRFQYKNSPARLRLPDPGQFNIEIPTTAPDLEAGTNRLTISIVDADDRRESAELTFAWDPSPVALPLDLSDLSRFASVQDIGQIVNGAFDLDQARGAIRARAPVAPDALLLLGSPGGDQEATYQVRFSRLERGKYLGLSDFFAGHEAEEPPIGIKPGWSTAGLATLTYGWRPGAPPDVRRPAPGQPIESLAGESPTGEVRVWLASGDNTHRGERWVVKTDPPATIAVAEERPYRVRHRLTFRDGVNRVQLRIWPAASPEPSDWLCDEDDRSAPPGAPRFTAASFGLFQHTGMSTEWSDIRIAPC